MSSSTLSDDLADHHPLRPDLDDEGDCIPVGIQPDCEAKGFLGILFKAKGAPQIVVLTLAVSLAIGPLVSAVPDVVEDRYARLLHNYDGPHCSIYDRPNKPAACLEGGDNAQNAAAKSAFCQNVIIFLSNSVIGSISDSHGRRGFFSFSLFLAALAPIALLLLQIFESMNPVWYYAADASTGLVNSLSVSFTMLSDVLAPSHRAPIFGVLIAAYLLGFALSQLLAFFTSHMAVSILAVALLTAALAVSLAAVPETLSDEARKRALSRRRSDGAATAAGCGVLLRPIREISILNRDRAFRTLSVVAFCSGLVYTSDKTLMVYYVEDVLGISYRDVASMFFAMSLLGVLLQVFFLGPAIGWLGEKGLLVATCACGAAHNVLYGVAASRAGVLAALCLSDLTALTFPVQISMRSNLVDEAEQGRVQGAFMSLTAVADAIGPVTLQLIFHRTEHGAIFGTGTMFLFAALVYMFGGLFACSLPADRVNLGRQRQGGTLTESHRDAQEPLLSSDGSLGSDAQSTQDGECL